MTISYLFVIGLLKIGCYLESNDSGTVSRDVMRLQHTRGEGGRRVHGLAIGGVGERNDLVLRIWSMTHWRGNSLSSLLA